MVLCQEILSPSSNHSALLYTAAYQCIRPSSRSYVFLVMRVIPSDSAHKHNSKLFSVTLKRRKRKKNLTVYSHATADYSWCTLSLTSIINLSHYGLMSHRFWGSQLCVPLGFIQGSYSKDVTKQQEPYEGFEPCVIIVYLCLFSFNGGS